MRRLSALLVVACLLGIGAGSAIAQSPSPPPWFGGRVEMPEHGFAVTLPDEWVGFDTAADAMSQREAASGVLDPVLWNETDTEWVDGFAQVASTGLQLWSGHATKEDSCGLGTWISDLPLDDVADNNFEWYSDDPGSRDVEPPRLIDLPAGPAYHIRMSQQVEPDSDEWWSVSHYFVGLDGFMLQAYCLTDDIRPADDWLSIVETIELLPAEEPAPPPWLGGRVEMPEHGFAVTLPDDWVAFDTAADAMSQLEVALDILDPAYWSTDETEWVDGLAWQASQGVPLYAAHATSSGSCRLAPWLLDPSFTDAVYYHFEWYSDNPDIRDIAPRLINLPTGTAYHIQATQRSEADPDEWWPLSHYLLETDGTTLEAYCSTRGPRPDDDWLSIVETIEYLPVEE